MAPHVENATQKWVLKKYFSKWLIILQIYFVVPVDLINLLKADSLTSD